MWGFCLSLSEMGATCCWKNRSRNINTHTHTFTYTQGHWGGILPQGPDILMGGGRRAEPCHEVDGQGLSDSNLKLS